MRAPPSALLVLAAACTAPAPELAPPAGQAAAGDSAPPASVAHWAALGGPADGPAPQAAVADATRALFVANCAQCHGEQGDGEGVTQLDRKARSFLEGGFSYGNTKEAILRSITHGIPGTPMPPFEKALSPEQCAALAEYVIALGPERIVVDPSESELVVRDRPVVVYGKLPALLEGGPEIPRGIAIGTPDGLTFEYRADDVQLVRVRAGSYLNRTDWDGRGGTALEMLGKAVWSAESVGDVVRFSDPQDGTDGAAPPRTPTRWLASEVRGDEAFLEYELRSRTPDTGPIRVRETVRGFQCELGTGFIRRLVVSGASDAHPVRVSDFDGVARNFGAAERGSGSIGTAGDSSADGRTSWGCRYDTSSSPAFLTALVASARVDSLSGNAPRIDLRAPGATEIAIIVIPAAVVPSERQLETFSRIFGGVL